MKYLVDSDWLIDALAGIPSAIDVLDRLSTDGVGVSIVTLGEFYEGAFNSTDAEARLGIFRRFLSSFPVLGLSESTMEIFARTRAQLRREGLLIPDLDLLIAATAITSELSLITRNYQRVPDLVLYQAL